jgi:hypothetical protein
VNHQIETLIKSIKRLIHIMQDSRSLIIAYIKTQHLRCAKSLLNIRLAIRSPIVLGGLYRLSDVKNYFIIF